MMAASTSGSKNNNNGGGVAQPAGFSQCEDFIQFENALRQSRTVDDKIIQALNNSLPNAALRAREGVDTAGKCKDLWKSIESAYAFREKAINKCIGFTEDKVRQMREAGDKSGARQKTVTLRMLESEMSVESVVRNRTQTAFHEKCRDHYKPPL